MSDFEDDFLEGLENINISKKGELSKSEKMNKENQQKVINRINEIIAEANITSMGGRSKNYIKGSGGKKLKNNQYPRILNRNFNFIDPQTGMMHLSQSAHGYNLEENMYPTGKMKKMKPLYYDQVSGGGPYGNSLSYGGNIYY